jgi:hypothetical protein
MKFEFKDGLIWIPVFLEYEGKQIKIERCILDTGSSTTAIDIDFVDLNYQKPSFIRRLCGLGGGTQEVVCQKIDNLRIGKTELKEIEIEFGNIEEGFGIQGFIGNDVLRRFTFTINFINQDIDMILNEQYFEENKGM